MLSDFLYYFIADAQPTEAEKEVYDEAQVVLERAHRILQELQEYKGASQEIRKAIGAPDSDSEKQAWEAVLPLVSRLKEFFLFSKELGKHRLIRLSKKNTENVVIN